LRFSEVSAAIILYLTDGSYADGNRSQALAANPGKPVRVSRYFTNWANCALIRTETTGLSVSLSALILRLSPSTTPPT
jgi:hypothetical protein